MTAWIDRFLESRPVRRFRLVQFGVVVALYVYAYLSPAPVGRGMLPLGETTLHAIGSGLLFASAWIAARHRLGLWGTAALAGLLSFGLEFAQSFAPLRHFDWNDLVMNGLGVLVSALTLAAFRRRGWVGRG